MPEFPVFASTETDTHEAAAAGIVDAIAFDAEGAPQVLIDWKSDVEPVARDARPLPRPGPRLPRHHRRGTRTYRRNDLWQRPPSCTQWPGALLGAELCPPRPQSDTLNT